jgi:hypothetical protein
LKNHREFGTADRLFRALPDAWTRLGSTSSSGCSSSHHRVMRADMLPFEARNLILVRWLQTSVISISGGGRWTMYAACPGDTTMLSR